MTKEPHQQAASDEADRSKESSPIGVAEDLEEQAEAVGATTAPDATPEGERQLEQVDDPDGHV